MNENLEHLHYCPCHLNHIRKKKGKKKKDNEPVVISNMIT